MPPAGRWRKCRDETRTHACDRLDPIYFPDRPDARGIEWIAGLEGAMAEGYLIYDDH